MSEKPGQRIIDAGTTPRQILMSTANVIELPGPIWIDGTNSADGSNTSRVDELRAGWLMAQITASKKWVPCKRTRVKTGTTGTVTALTVDNAAAFLVGETISVGADTGLVITAINYLTNTLTIASTAVVDGEAVVVTTLKDGTTSAAGVEIARAILSQTVRLLTGIPYESTQVDKEGVLLMRAYINSTMVLGDRSAITASSITNYLSGLQFSDLQQGV